MSFSAADWGSRECEGVGFMCVKGLEKNVNTTYFYLCPPIAQLGVDAPDRYCGWAVDVVLIYGTMTGCIGGLAQLGERLAGSQKVIGSSPLSSSGRKALIYKHLRLV